MHQSFYVVKLAFEPFFGGLYAKSQYTPFKDKLEFQLKDGELHSPEYIYSVPATKSNCRVSSISKTCFHGQQDPHNGEKTAGKSKQKLVNSLWHPLKMLLAFSSPKKGRDYSVEPLLNEI